MHGGVKFYRGSPAAARSYVETDRCRVDDYYLADGTGLATRYVAERATEGGPGVVTVGGMLDGPAYERWVAGYEVDTGRPKGRLRVDVHGLRFVEVVVNGPKTWSLAASLHPQIAAAYDAAQDRAAIEIIGWLAEHATTRVGPRGRQVQVPVERLEAAVVRHYTSRAGDPHRHLHLQVNARVFAAGSWRGLHSVGVVDSIEALNGIGHAAVMCDPELRATLAAHGYTLDLDSGEITQLAGYVGAFSARSSQITRNIDRYEAEWRRDHPDREPGPGLRRAWDRRAWAQARPDKVVPADGAELRRLWVEELAELGFTPPTAPDRLVGAAIGRLDRDAVVGLVLTRLGARRSSWNAADIRGEVERIVASVGIVAPAPVRRELVEDLTGRTCDQCAQLLQRADVPEHVRALTSREVLDVEADLVDRLMSRDELPTIPVWVDALVAGRVLGSRLDHAQQRVVAALVGHGRLLVIEGAAGAGKTTTLAAARELLEGTNRRLVVVTPTLKAARVAGREVGTEGCSAAWLIHQYGYRWDDDGRRWRVDAQPGLQAHLLAGDMLLVDEAGMLDQDTAQALLTIADETGARIAFVGDRHQLPAVGRGGVLDHAARWAPPGAHLTLDSVHRFSDPRYAELSLLMRTGQRAGEVFDELVSRGEIIVHRSEVERFAALTAAGGLIVADTREQVAALNAAIRDHRLTTRLTTRTEALTTGLTTSLTPEHAAELTTRAGERVGVGDRIATRRNDRDLGVANRDTWTVTGLGQDGSLTVAGGTGQRWLPAAYVQEHVELAYATTIHGAQGETVHQAHLLLGETTGAAAAYVAMTRGRDRNTAHLVADTIGDARKQWIVTFNRDRADLGPRHAARAASQATDRYGPNAPRRHPVPQPPIPRHDPEHHPSYTRGPDRAPGIGI